MKKKLFCVVALVPLMFFSLMTSYGISAEKPIELRFTTTVTSIHPTYIVLQEFASEVNKRTKGRVQITVYPSGTLNPPLESYNAVVSGIAQIGAVPTGYSAQVMPLSKLFGDALRMMGNSTEAANAWKTALERLPEMKNEFKELHLLWVYATIPMGLHTTKKEVKKVEDLKGLILRVPPGTEPVAKAWGVSAMSVPIADLYVSLQKNVINGFVGGSEGLKANRLAEQVKYTADLNMIHGLQWVGVNKKVWDSLPPDIQKTMTEVSAWITPKHNKTVDKVGEEVDQFAVSQGTKIVKIDKAELEKIHSLARPTWEKIAADLEAKGKPGKKVLQEVDRIVAEKK
jgi:TRAP-type C4-dicarboxylate transport system substrate-binding protein